MSHMPPFRLNVPNLGDITSGGGPSAPSNPKKRRKNAQQPIQPPPNVQDLLPPPLTGYGDTIVASNPFDDCPSNVNPVSVRSGPPMGMIMGGQMGQIYRSMCPMGSPMMHSPNHQMMMNGPRMGHMGGPPGHGGPPPPHMMASPNGPPGGPMGPNMNMTGPPMHSPIGGMGGPGGGGGPGPQGGQMGSPMGGHGGPMNGGPGMGGPMNGPPMGHGHHGGPGAMQMSTPNGPPPIGPPMGSGGNNNNNNSSNNNNSHHHGGGGGGNNNFMMSPSMGSMYPKPMPVSAGKVYPADQPMVFNSQNPNAPPIYPCGVCHKEVHDNDQAILCESGCNFWFHRGCTGLTEAAFQLLTAEVYAEWVCDKCLQSKNIPLVKFKP